MINLVEEHEVKGSQRVLERKPFPLRYTLGMFKCMVLTDETKGIPGQGERGNFPSLPNCRQVILIWAYFVSVIMLVDLDWFLETHKNIL